MKTPRYICVKEAGDGVNVIGRVDLAEFRLYWPSWSVLAKFVTHMIRTAFAI